MLEIISSFLPRKEDTTASKEENRQIYMLSVRYDTLKIIAYPEVCDVCVLC